VSPEFSQEIDKKVMRGHCGWIESGVGSNLGMGYEIYCTKAFQKSIKIL